MRSPYDGLWTAIKTSCALGETCVDDQPSRAARLRVTSNRGFLAEYEGDDLVKVILVLFTNTFMQSVSFRPRADQAQSIFPVS